MRKKSGRWYIRYTEYHRGPDGRLQSKHVERAAGPDKNAARQEEIRLREYWEGIKFGRTPPATIDEVLLAYLKTQTESPSFKSYRSNAKHLRRELGNPRVDELTQARLKQYGARREAQGASGTTVNHEIQLLSKAIKHANEINDWELKNPCPGTRRKANPPRVRWLSDEEQKRLIQAAGKIDHAPLLQPWIIIAITTGMRYREITELEWKRIDLDHGLIHLEPEHNKTRDQRAVPIIALTAYAIESIRTFHRKHNLETDRLFVTTQGRPLQTIGKRAWKKACELAGIESLKMSDLRHVCATSIVRKGGRLEDVKELLGHKSIKTTEIYAHFSPQASRDAVGVLERVENLWKQEEGEDSNPL